MRRPARARSVVTGDRVNRSPPHPHRCPEARHAGAAGRRAVRRDRDRREPGRPRRGLPPAAARAAVRDPRCQRARRRRVAVAMGLPAAVHAGPLRRPAGDAVPGRPACLPDQGPGGRLPRGLRPHFELPVRTGVKVDRVQATPDGSGFVVKSGDRVFVAEQVVLATGAFHQPRVPDFAGDLDPGIVQLHSSDYRRPSQLRDGRVLVVGAANSGAEIALDVARAGGRRRRWRGAIPGSFPFDIEGRLGRWLDPLIWFGANHILTVHTPIGRKARAMFLFHGHPGRAGATAPARGGGRGAHRGARRRRQRRPAACSTTAPCSTSRTSSGAPGTGATTRGSSRRSRTPTAGPSRSGASLPAWRACISSGCRSRRASPPRSSAGSGATPPTSGTASAERAALARTRAPAGAMPAGTVV